MEMVEDAPSSKWHSVAHRVKPNSVFVVGKHAQVHSLHNQAVRATSRQRSSRWSSREILSLLNYELHLYIPSREILREKVGDSY